MQTFATLDGDAVAVPIRRRALPISPGQMRARRNALWLHAVEEGIIDPILGRRRPHSVSELAQLWGLSDQAILNGLAAARATRAMVRKAAVGE